MTIATMKRIAKLEVNENFVENVKRAFISRHNVIVELIMINPRCNSKEYKAYEDNGNPISILFTVHDNKVKDVMLVDKFETS